MMPEISPEGPVPVEAVFTLMPEDIAALQSQNGLRGRSWWAPLFWVVVAGSIAIGLWRMVNDQSFGLALVVLGIFMLAERLFLGSRVDNWQLRRMRLADGPTRLTADEDGLRLVNPVADTRLSWKNIVRMQRTDSHYFFWVNKMHAVIVPLRALDAEAARAGLWDLASRNVTPRNG